MPWRRKWELRRLRQSRPRIDTETLATEEHGSTRIGKATEDTDLAGGVISVKDELKVEFQIAE
jgi:hypothetical protein